MAVKKKYHSAASVGRNLGFGQNGSSFMFQQFQNIYTDNDYDTLEDLWANTIAGTAEDVRVDFTLGSGIKPVLKLNNPKDFGDETKQQAAIEEYSDTTEELIKFDNKRKIRFPKKLKDGQRMKKIFGRAVIAFEMDKNDELPTALKPLHSRDLGRVFVHQDDWSLSSVHAFQKSQNIKTHEMIYLVHMDNSPRRRSMHYGYSSIQRVVGEARALRSIMEVDGPEIAASMWAGSGILTVDTLAKSPTGAQNELDAIKGGVTAGLVSLINGKKDDFNFFNIDTNPKIEELMKMADRYERTIIGNAQVPSALLGREEDSNMATLFGKIRMFFAGPVKSDRDDLSEAIDEQWYNRNLNLINPALAKIAHYESEFETIVLESWVDVVEALGKLRAIFPNLPEEELLTLANLPEMKDKLKGKNQKTVDVVKMAKDIKKKSDHGEIAMPGTLLKPDEFPTNPLEKA